MTVLRDLEYVVAGDQALQLDLYVPADAAAGAHPVCLWLHGGAWLYGDRATNVGPLAHGLAERGIAIASIVGLDPGVECMDGLSHAGWAGR